MPKTIRNQFEKNLTYEKLEWAHKLSQKGKTTKKDVVLFNLKKVDNCIDKQEILDFLW